jgi:hypothetical protein
LRLAHGAEKPAMLTPQETLALPAALGLAALFMLFTRTG